MTRWAKERKTCCHCSKVQGGHRLFFAKVAYFAKMDGKSDNTWLGSLQNSVENGKECFAWSFQPICICLRLFGVDLKWKQRSKYQCLTYLCCVVWFVINVAVVVGIGIRLHSDEKPPSHGKVTQNLFLGILAVETTGIYAVFVFSNWKHSRQLVDSINQIEVATSVDKEAYRKLRIVALIGIVLSIIDVML